MQVRLRAEQDFLEKHRVLQEQKERLDAQRRVLEEQQRRLAQQHLELHQQHQQQTSQARASQLRAASQREELQQGLHEEVEAEEVDPDEVSQRAPPGQVRLVQQQQPQQVLLQQQALRPQQPMLLVQQQVMQPPHQMQQVLLQQRPQQVVQMVPAQQLLQVQQQQQVVEAHLPYGANYGTNAEGQVRRAIGLRSQEFGRDGDAPGGMPAHLVLNLTSAPRVLNLRFVLDPLAHALTHAGGGGSACDKGRCWGLLAVMMVMTTMTGLMITGSTHFLARAITGRAPLTLAGFSLASEFDGVGCGKRRHSGTQPRARSLVLHDAAKKGWRGRE